MRAGWDIHTFIFPFLLRTSRLFPWHFHFPVGRTTRHGKDETQLRLAAEGAAAVQLREAAADPGRDLGARVHAAVPAARHALRAHVPLPGGAGCVSPPCPQRPPSLVSGARLSRGPLGARRSSRGASRAPCRRGLTARVAPSPPVGLAGLRRLRFTDDSRAFLWPGRWRAGRAPLGAPARPARRSVSNAPTAISSAVKPAVSVFSRGSLSSLRNYFFSSL